MVKINCKHYNECLENKDFHPFCYEVGPPKGERFIKKKIKDKDVFFQTSGTCWKYITGNEYQREIKDKGDIIDASKSIH